MMSEFVQADLKDIIEQLKSHSTNQMKIDFLLQLLGLTEGGLTSSVKGRVNVIKKNFFLGNFVITLIAIVKLGDPMRFISVRS